MKKLAALIITGLCAITSACSSGTDSNVKTPDERVLTTKELDSVPALLVERFGPCFPDLTAESITATGHEFTATVKAGELLWTVGKSNTDAILTLPDTSTADLADESGCND